MDQVSSTFSTIPWPIENVDNELFDLTFGEGGVFGALALEIAANALRITQRRHPGGPLSREDRNAVAMVLLVCHMALVVGLDPQEIRSKN